MALSCDGCALCCKVLSIDALDKPAGRWCRAIKRGEHGRSCGVYQDRPGACRTFECLWLASQARPGQEMQPELRPDRSHIVFCMDFSVGLDASDGERVLVAHVDEDWPNAWRSPLPRLAIRTFVTRGGTVIVYIGKRRVLLRPNRPPLFTTEDNLAVASIVMRGRLQPGSLPPDMPPPTFDVDELMRRLG